MEEGREERRPAPEIFDPSVPGIDAYAREPLPPRCVADLYTDTILGVAYYGKLKTRKGNYDTHMDHVQEGQYEF